MKVLMTADAVGGVWTYALDLALGLSERRVETVLAVLGPLTLHQRAQAALISGLSVVETGLQLDWVAEDADEVLAAGQAVAELADENDVDVVHLNSPALAAGHAFRRPIVGVCHSCVATWWAAVRSGPLPADFAWRTDLVRRGYAACDGLIAPSRAFADATRDAYGLSIAPIAVHNGRGWPSASAHWSDETFVLTAGRLWDEGKNAATLDRAAAQLDMPVRAAGATSGPNGTSLELRQIEALGSLGPAELGDLMDQQPIFVSLALYEPFGLAVLEAAQRGCALVLSDVSSFRELWDGAATFVPARDEGKAAEAVRSLAGNDALRAERGDAARRRAERYGIDGMTAGTLAVYASVLDPAGTQAPPARELVA